MAGLRNLCRLYGRMNLDGVWYVWDYHREDAFKESEMTKEDQKRSEKAKWLAIKKQNGRN